MELIEVILSKENLNRAYKKVVSNKGASGVDGVTVEELGDYIRENKDEIVASIRNRTYMVMYGSPVLQIQQELNYMVEYGITPVQAIQTATSNPAKVLGKEKELGLLEEGFIADIAVVDGDLSEDIKNIYNIHTVYLNGKKVYDEGVRYV